MEKTLELIGSVKPGQKFYIKNDTLNVEENPGHLTIIAWRWYTTNNRVNTVDFISKKIKLAFFEKAPSQKILLARAGVANLMETYKSDAKTVKRLQELIEFINFEIKILQRDEYIWQNSSDRSSPISFPPSPSCAITVSTGAKEPTPSKSSSVTSEQFKVGSLPKSSRRR